MIQAIAYLTMLINHFFEWHWIGVALPIFCYLVAKNIDRTKNIKDYQIRILFIAIVSQLFWPIRDWPLNHMNDVFAIFLGVTFLMQKKEINKLILGIAIILGWLYQIVSALPLLLMLIAREKKKVYLSILLILIIILTMIDITNLRWILVIPIIYFEDSFPKMRIPKIIKYTIYPLHLAIIKLTGV